MTVMTVQDRKGKEGIGTHGVEGERRGRHRSLIMDWQPGVSVIVEGEKR